MRNLAESIALCFYIAVGLIAVCCMWIVMNMPAPRPPSNRLCPVAEISPDITPAERELCRQIRGHKL